jgi:hypothetical protein
MDEIILKEGTYATLDRTPVEVGGMRAVACDDYAEGFGQFLEIKSKGEFCAMLYRLYDYGLAHHLRGMMEEECVWKIHLDEPSDYIKNGLHVKLEELREGQDYITLGKGKDYAKEAAVLYTALSRIYGADNEQLDDARENAFAALSEVSNDFRNEFVSHAYKEDDEPTIYHKMEPAYVEFYEIDKKTRRAISWRGTLDEIISEQIELYSDRHPDWEWANTVSHIRGQPNWESMMIELVRLMESDGTYNCAWNAGEN